MDFTLDPEAAAVDEAADEVIRRLDQDWTSMFAASGYDDDAWRAFVDAGFPAMPLPESADGDGLDIAAVRPLVTRAGRDAVVTPLLGAVTAALVLREDVGLAAAAVAEPGSALGARPTTVLHDGAVTGIKVGVLHADAADALLVTTDGGAVLVDAGATGVAIVRTTSSSGWGECTVRFDGAPGRVVDDSERLVDVHRAVLAAYASGLVAGALARTAEHVGTRHQFGRPIAEFQAVGQQLADVYVTATTLDLVATTAAWELAQGSDAQHDLATAMHQIAAELPSTMRTMTHLHGGIGVDVTYPLHRYFSLAKDLARLVGGAGATLEVLACS